MNNHLPETSIDAIIQSLSPDSLKRKWEEFLKDLLKQPKVANEFLEQFKKLLINQSPKKK